MLNVLLCGIGGQGTVLAAKLLAQAAQSKGWQVRTAETIGMAQRGGSVVSHVRMGNDVGPDGAPESVESPLLPLGSAALVVAFEPSEAARALPYLAPDGVLVTATTAVQPVTAALSKKPYQAEGVLANLRALLAGSPATLVEVDDAALLSQVGSPKALNVVLLATALSQGHVPLTLDDLRAAVRACVKPAFIDMNLQAINIAAK
ncbi:MAG: 2-oxoacid:acceptor oxidoreductase family protein [Coriobacteriia bacterium]|nr:2-oxoacid:acceptor oxidoreductase family protein [Coriobacteriia bacterium]